MALESMPARRVEHASDIALSSARAQMRGPRRAPPAHSASACSSRAITAIATKELTDVTMNGQKVNPFQPDVPTKPNWSN